MTLAELADRLSGVRPTRNGLLACCPAHEDTHPSLSVREGTKGLLVWCWANCRQEAILSRLGLTFQDLFYDALDSNPAARRAAAQARAQQRRASELAARRHGRRLDALREADYFVRSRQQLDISTWSAHRLNQELNLLADAYTLLDAEAGHG